MCRRAKEQTADLLTKGQFSVDPRLQLCKLAQLESRPSIQDNTATPAQVQRIAHALAIKSTFLRRLKIIIADLPSTEGNVKRVLRTVACAAMAGVSTPLLVGSRSVRCAGPQGGGKFCLYYPRMDAQLWQCLHRDPRSAHSK